MTIGQERVLEKYKGEFNLAVALIKGNVSPGDAYWAGTLLSESMIAAAKAHIELGFDKKIKK